MIDSSQVRARISSFIVENFLFKDAAKAPAGQDSLIGKGILDSTGVLELIDFLEKEYGVVVEDFETTPDNLDSIDSIIKFVEKKTA